MSLLNMYVDGFNLYHAIADLNDNRLKWLNLRALAKSFLLPDEALGDVYFFTAVVDWNPGKRTRHREYIKALEAVGVVVVEGKFKSSPRHCPINKIKCPDREEKQTDVAIGVQMVSDALLGKFSRAVLVTADTDQIPTVKTIKNLRPDVKMVLAAPPNRLATARELGEQFKKTDRIELTAGRLGTCKLPKVVMDVDGTALAYRPIEYD